MADPDPLEHIEIEPHDEFLEARFLGAFTVARFNRQVDTSAAACRERKLSLLLIDLTDYTAKLSTTDRFEIATHGARVASDLKIAIYLPPVLVDPKKFGVLVARNRGLNVEPFTDRQKAVEWLLASR